MSKRRINKQQSARIEKIQQTYQHTKKSDADNLFEGLIITRYHKEAEVEIDEGVIIRCSIRPNLENLVAGDRIIWQKEGSNQGVVVSLYPRTSLLARPNQSGVQKPVAANITQMIIVIAPKPEISWALLDSYLIIAETLRIQGVILLNKTDLIEAEALKINLLRDYQSLDYPILFTQKNDVHSLELLNEQLNQQVSVFVGQSGVGKSSLISRILPHEKINTQEISTLSELGQHTTSNSRYYHLTNGGALIDSPGVREFNLWNMDPITIAQGYQEFQPYIASCKFRNCTHSNTPSCAIIKAVEEGNIAPARYENFLKLCGQMIKLK